MSPAREDGELGSPTTDTSPRADTAAGLRPLIGLTTYRETAAWGAWNLPADLLPSVYARSVEAAGGIAVLLPPQPEAAARVVHRLDGLVVSGGADVDPDRYSRPAHSLTSGLRPDRDSWELALLEAAQQVGLPTLGICRGMQVMAVHAGGRLQQHVPDVVGHEEHSPGPSSFGWTSVRTDGGSLLQRLVGDQMQVSCHHHQAVAEHPGFQATARAADGTIEGIEHLDRAFWLAVQWHPENGDDYGLFRGLVAAATSRLSAR